jgi:hypothetical protein
MTIEKALAHKEGGNNLTWGTFVRDSMAGMMPTVPGAIATDPPKKATGKASKAKK